MEKILSYTDFIEIQKLNNINCDLLMEEMLLNEAFLPNVFDKIKIIFNNINENNKKFQSGIINLTKAIFNETNANDIQNKKKLFINKVSNLINFLDEPSEDTLSHTKLALSNIKNVNIAIKNNIKAGANIDVKSTLINLAKSKEFKKIYLSNHLKTDCQL